MQEQNANLTQLESSEKVIEISTERLKPFKNHPFQVVPDADMVQLKESIQQYGVLNPLIVRPTPEGNYEIISGHRRKYVAEQLGYTKVPVIIRYMKDDDAIVTMVDSNIQREQIRPSEKAFAYKMKHDAIKRKAGRRKVGQVDYDLIGKKSIELISGDQGDSPKQVQRYIKLTNLIPELLQKLDDGIISFTPAVELAFLSQSEQTDMLEAMDYAQSIPSLSQAQRIKKLSIEGTLSLQKMEDILSEIKQSEVQRVVFTNEQLHRFFPEHYTVNQTKRAIIEILEHYTETYYQSKGGINNSEKE